MKLRTAIAATLVIVGGMTACDAGPKCHEDEVRVVVYDDPNHLIGEGTLGCVPADNLPVTGYRP